MLVALCVMSIFGSLLGLMEVKVVHVPKLLLFESSTVTVIYFWYFYQAFVFWGKKVTRVLGMRTLCGRSEVVCKQLGEALFCCKILHQGGRSALHSQSVLVFVYVLLYRDCVSLYVHMLALIRIVSLYHMLGL